MAKCSAIMRNKKRITMAERGKAIREKLKNIIKKDPENAEEAVVKLNNRKRDESPVRIRDRCQLCGRPNGTFKKFGLCRICLRLAAMRGDVPGLKKASW